MSNSLKFKTIRTCASLRSYMKHCHLTHKFTAPRECPPGPLQRLLSQNMGSLRTLRSNRAHGSASKRTLIASPPLTSTAPGADFDMVKFEPIANRGNYWQVLVTLKRRDGGHGRDRWVRDMRRHDNRTGLNATNAISAIRLANICKNKKSKINQSLDFSHDQEPPTEEPNVMATWQHDPYKAMESIGNLLQVATEKILGKPAKPCHALKTPKISKLLETYSAEEIVSKLRNKHLEAKICPAVEMEEHDDAQDECETSMNRIKAQIQDKSKRFSKSYEHPSVKSCDSLRSLSPTEDLNPDSSTNCVTETRRKSSTSVLRFPKVHINVKGSISLKRNLLGKLEGKSRTKISTRIQKNDGRPTDKSST